MLRNATLAVGTAENELLELFDCDPTVDSETFSLSAKQVVSVEADTLTQVIVINNNTDIILVECGGQAIVYPILG